MKTKIIKRNKLLLGVGGLILLSIIVFCMYQTTVERGVEACSTDSDCGWCGANCVVPYPGMICALMMPPDGYDCKCVAGKCSSVPTPTTTTLPSYVL